MSGLHRVLTSRVECALLESRFTVLIKDRLQANEETDPAKWALWKIIWECSTFEQLAAVAPDPVNTTRTGRRITWRSEVRWALRRGWIQKQTTSSSNNL